MRWPSTSEPSRAGQDAAEQRTTGRSRAQRGGAERPPVRRGHGTRGLTSPSQALWRCGSLPCRHGASSRVHRQRGGPNRSVGLFLSGCARGGRRRLLGQGVLTPGSGTLPHLPGKDLPSRTVVLVVGVEGVEVEGPHGPPPRGCALAAHPAGAHRQRPVTSSSPVAPAETTDCSPATHRSDPETHDGRVPPLSGGTRPSCYVRPATSALLAPRRLGLGRGGRASASVSPCASRPRRSAAGRR